MQLRFLVFLKAEAGTSAEFALLLCKIVSSWSAGSRLKDVVHLIDSKEIKDQMQSSDNIKYCDIVLLKITTKKYLLRNLKILNAVLFSNTVPCQMYGYWDCIRKW